VGIFENFMKSFFKGFLNIVGNKDVSLGALLVAFWILFYGVFTLSLKKMRFGGDHDPNNKLVRLISGTLSAVIVLGSLIVVPRGRMVEYAQQVMGAFNVVFAAILSIVIFFVFRGLMSTEDPSVKNQAGLWGLLISLFLFGSLGQGGELGYWAQTLSWVGLWLLFAYGVYYIWNNAFGSDDGSGVGSDLGSDPNFQRDLDNISDIEDDDARAKAVEKRVDKRVHKAERDFAKLKKSFKNIEKKLAEQLELVEYITPFVKDWELQDLDKLDKKDKDSVLRLVQYPDFVPRQLKSLEKDLERIQYDDLEELLSRFEFEQNPVKLANLEAELGAAIVVEVKSLNRIAASLKSMRDLVPSKKRFNEVKAALEAGEA
jgi:predicted permease